MNAPQLGIDHEDLSLDILPAIERSFGIRFTETDFHEPFTYGELGELVRRKLPPATATDCTTQQAFYKLRRALVPLVGGVGIRPSTRLADLLPARRRELATRLDAALGLELELLTMPQWVEFSGLGLLLAAVVLVPVSICAAGLGGADWAGPTALLMLGCFGLACGTFALGTRFGQRLRFTTMRDLAEHMSTRHYRQARRWPDTANPQEVQARLDALFIDMAGLQAAELLPEAAL